MSFITKLTHRLFGNGNESSQAKSQMGTATNEKFNVFIKTNKHLRKLERVAIELATSNGARAGMTDDEISKEIMKQTGMNYSFSVRKFANGAEVSF